MTDQAPTPEAAQSQIAALKTDASFIERYLAGDPAAREQFDTLHAQAFPAGPSPDFSPEQQKAMAADLVKRGAMTQAQADEALRAAGIEPDAAPPSPEVAELMAAFPAAKPEQYDLAGLFGDRIEDPKVAAIDSATRNWLATARFPAREGSALAREIAAVNRQVADMDDARRELYRREQRLMLQNLWREKFAENLAWARKLVDELEEKAPGFADVLEETGGGDSALVINLLFAQADRLRMIYEAKQRARGN